MLKRFEITSRSPYAGGRVFGVTGAYEQVDGKAHFAVDPAHPANQMATPGTHAKSLQLSLRPPPRYVLQTTPGSTTAPTSTARPTA